MTVKDLIDKISELEYRFKSSNMNLEDYWRSMYPLAIKNKNEIPSLELFFKLIKNAIDKPPIEFKPEWLTNIKPPISNFYEERVKKGVEKLNSDFGDFEFFLKILEFQIAELHKMKEKQLRNKFKYFGVESEAGNRWFNFDPIGVLECGLIGMISNGFNKDLESWIFLGEIIEMGRIYE